jgi:hypothetical protein
MRKFFAFVQRRNRERKREGQWDECAGLKLRCLILHVAEKKMDNGDLLLHQDWN